MQPMQNSIATAPPQPRPTARGYLPIFVFLAYTAFLITGFGAKLNNLQPVPVYIFFCLLLLTLQETIAAHRSHARFAYIFITSAFAVLFAGDVVFRPVLKANFTHSPWTYLIINALVVLVYLWDVFQRRLLHPEGIRGSLASYSMLAADFSGLAIVFFVSAFLMDLLGPQLIPHMLGIHLWQPYVVVDLNSALHLSLKSPINELQGLDFVAALVATAITFLFLVIVGVLLPGTSEAAEQAGTPRLGLNETLRAIAHEAGDQVSYSLSLVLGPFVWLIPAFSIAFFSQMVTHYLNLSAASKGTILDLFNPFSVTSRDNYGLGIATLLLGLLAVASVVIAVAIVEHDRAVVQHTLRIFGQASRVVLVIWVFFIYSLAVINAIGILLGVTDARPFQVGAPGLISLVFALWFFWRESQRARRAYYRRPPLNQPAPSVVPTNRPGTAPGPMQNTMQNTAPSTLPGNASGSYPGSYPGGYPGPGQR